MYGKTFESMYDGSMIGAGINVFAVWNWIITKARGGCIEVNPKLLAFTLGGTEKDVTSALAFLTKPDEGSRSRLEEGRRLVKEGQYQYRVVNWDFYQKIRNEDDRREYNRRKQAEYRARKKLKSKPLAGEERTLQRLAAGEITQEHADNIAADTREH